MHPIVKNLMKIRRIVILPEYQGFGLGIKFMNQVSDLYIKDYRVNITTSLKPFILSLKNNKNWICTSFQRGAKQGNALKNRKGEINDASKRIVGIFEYQPKN